MTKSDLVKAVAKRAGTTQDTAARAIDAFTAAVAEALGRGESVKLVGFGEFTVRERAARRGRDPRSGASVTIPARKVPGFKAGAGLREAVAR